MEGDMSQAQTSESPNVTENNDTKENKLPEIERFAASIVDQVEERRSKREKQTIARNEKLDFLRERFEAFIKQFDDVKAGYARIEEEYVALDDAWAEFKAEMYAITYAA
jgi:hypothetical protein